MKTLRFHILLTIIILHSLNSYSQEVKHNISSDILKKIVDTISKKLLLNADTVFVFATVNNYKINTLFIIDSAKYKIGYFSIVDRITPNSKYRRIDTILRKQILLNELIENGKNFKYYIDSLDNTYKPNTELCVDTKVCYYELAKGKEIIIQKYISEVIPIKSENSTKGYDYIFKTICNISSSWLQSLRSKHDKIF